MKTWAEMSLRHSRLLMQTTAGSHIFVHNQALANIGRIQPQIRISCSSGKCRGLATPTTQTIMSETADLTTSFPPGICGEEFEIFESLDPKSRSNMEQQMNNLILSVKQLLASTTCGSSQQLKLIDDIQRLGVAYLFETELAEALEKIHDQLPYGDPDLLNDSLRFRLLRQHGYNISSENTFTKFKDANGCFKDTLISDVPGILSLYEATFLMVHGEEILEEALVFSTKHLELMKTQVSYPLTVLISESLEKPLWRRPERLSARNYIPLYETMASHNEALLNLSKLEFNLTQDLYKEELRETYRWWKELDFERAIPFARHRLVECYIGNLVMNYEPKYSVGRKIGTKLLYMATIHDDIYDSYGTFEQLKIFCEIIQRWDVNCCMDDLPECMKVYYNTLCKLMNEIEEELENNGIPSYRVHYAKQVFKDQAKDYLLEVKWLFEGSIPSMEEYLSVRVRSVGACETLLFILVGMNVNITNETFEWVLKYPKILLAVSFIFRFMDDIVGTKQVKQKGDVDSVIDCYMKQYGVSKEEAIEMMNKRIVDSRKEINEDLLRPFGAPIYVLLRFMNFTRLIDLAYTGEDGYKFPGEVLKVAIAALFGDPFPLE